MNTRLTACLFSLLMAAVALCAFPAGAFSGGKADDLELSGALRQAKLFAGLTDKERSALKSAVTLRHFKKGERIIEQGKSLGRMFIVLGSRAEVMVKGKLVATLPEQSLVGEIEFLDGLPASADVVVSGDGRVLQLNNAALASLMKKQPRLGYVLMSEIARIEARRLRAMDKE